MTTDRSEHIDACKKQKLCKALSSAYINDMDLEFYVSEDSESTDPGEIPIHIPIGLNRSRRYRDRIPTDNLWKMIKYGHFAKNESLELLLRAGNDAAIMGMDQRKTLAVQLVLGLMLSMDSDYIIHTWDPKRIYFLKPVDTEYTPFVSIYGDGDSSSRPNCRLLAKLDTFGDCEDGDDEPRPVLPLTLLAKTLLNIACGERLKDLKIAPSGTAFHDGWKKLRRLVEGYIKRVSCGKEVDRERLPFLHAALNCLDFHTRYQVRLTSAQSKHRIEIAWQLLFDDVIGQIDSSLTLVELIHPYTDVIMKEEAMPVASKAVVGEFSVPTVRSWTETSAVTAKVTQTPKEEHPNQGIVAITAQPEVALFDGENSTKDSM